MNSNDARPEAAAPRRPKDHTLEAWESMVDRAIREARANGEFDNLAGIGQPVRIERNPFAGDREVAFHALKNADLEPYWMSLDKELNAATARLERLLHDAVTHVEELRHRAGGGESRSRSGNLPRWRRWILGDDFHDSRVPGTVTIGAANRTRENWRERFLAEAAKVDRRIIEYNRALPDEIRWLERPRLLPGDAQRRFEERCPPLSCGNQ